VAKIGEKQKAQFTFEDVRNITHPAFVSTHVLVKRERGAQLVRNVEGQLMPRQSVLRHLGRDSFGVERVRVHAEPLINTRRDKKFWFDVRS
jgi:hypothetical protein